MTDKCQQFVVSVQSPLDVAGHGDPGEWVSWGVCGKEFPLMCVHKCAAVLCDVCISLA